MHNYLGDMSAEVPLYLQSGALLETLVRWDSDSRYLPMRLQALYVAMYERGFVELDDVIGVQLWLSALAEIGYTLPELASRPQRGSPLAGGGQPRSAPAHASSDRQTAAGIDDDPACVWHTMVPVMESGTRVNLGHTNSETECGMRAQAFNGEAGPATGAIFNAGASGGKCAAVLHNSALDWVDSNAANQGRGCVIVAKTSSTPWNKCPVFPPAPPGPVPPPQGHDQLTDSLLVLKFNFGFPEPACTIIELARRWSQVFTTVAVSGPFGKGHAAAVQAAGYHVHICLDDAGHYSPQEALLWAMELSNALNNTGGVVYMHDDMVIDTSRVPIWAGLAQPAITAGIPRPSDIADIEDNKNNAFGNPWWTHSSDVNRGGRGGGLPAMRATGKRWWALGQVDFVYIPPAPYPAQFIADLKLYLEKRVFSEIAVATAIHSAWTTLTALRLCTCCWDNRRTLNPVKMSSACLDEAAEEWKLGTRDKAPFDLFHPVKRQAGADWGAWDNIFARLSATNPNRVVAWTDRKGARNNPKKNGGTCLGRVAIDSGPQRVEYTCKGAGGATKRLPTVMHQPAHSGAGIAVPRFAYMFQGVTIDPRFLSTPDRDVFWLTFGTAAVDQGPFTIHRKNTTWATGRNALLDLARATGNNYTYYVFADDDALRMATGGPWELWEQWLIAESPTVGYFSRIVKWQVAQGLDAGATTRGRFNVDAIVCAVHQRGVRTLLPYDTALDGESWYYAAYLFNLKVAAYWRGPKGRVGWNIPHFDWTNNQHIDHRSYTRNDNWSEPVRWFARKYPTIPVRQKAWNAWGEQDFLPS